MAELDRRLRLRLVAVLSLLLVGAARPAGAADEDVQLWLPMTWTASFTDPFQGFYEVQPRIGEDISEITQLILRTALGYRFAPAWSGWLGYAWTPTFEPRNKNENRFFEQLLLVEECALLKLTSRTRFEQRWIEGVSGTSLRFRTLLRGVFPVTEDRLWAVALQDEVFFNLNTPSDNAPQAGFDQNRFFLGVNRVLNRWMSLDAGYLSQVVDTAEPGFPDRVNHVLLLQLYVNT